MTADVELLPLPEWLRGLGSVRENRVLAYAEANVAHATAAKDAEIEALRAKTAVTMGVGSGDGELFVHGDYESIKAAKEIVLRAERLAEALREYGLPLTGNDNSDIHEFGSVAVEREKKRRRALLRDQKP